MNKSNDANWKAFRIGDLFVKQDLKWKAKRKFDKSRDVSKTISKEYNLPLVNAKNGDNGIMYYGRMEDWEYADMCLDIVNDGAVSAGNVYAQPQKTGVLYNAYLVKPLFEGISQETLIFLACCLEKNIKHKYSYDNKATWEKVQSDTIYLPAKGTVPDWDYMSERVRELEEERVRELDAYLKATGLNDCELTEEDKKVLKDKDEVEFSEFIIGKLFNIATGRDVIIGNTENGEYPLVSHQNTENGITKYIAKLENRRLFNHMKTISLADRGMFWATTQDEDFYIGTRVKALVWKYPYEIQKSHLLYLACAINKLQILFSEYLTNATDKLPSLKIKLPITPTGEPNFDYMEKYIRATEKLVIADVVKWKDKQIELTKEVVNQEVS